MHIATFFSASLSLLSRMLCCDSPASLVLPHLPLQFVPPLSHRPLYPPLRHARWLFIIVFHPLLSIVRPLVLVLFFLKINVVPARRNMLAGIRSVLSVLRIMHVPCRRFAPIFALSLWTLHCISRQTRPVRLAPMPYSRMYSRTQRAPSSMLTSERLWRSVLHNSPGSLSRQPVAYGVVRKNVSPCFPVS